MSVADHERVSFDGAIIIEDTLKCLPNIEDICYTPDEAHAIMRKLDPPEGKQTQFQRIYYKVPCESTKPYHIDTFRRHADIIVGIYAKTDCTYTFSSRIGTWTYTIKKGDFFPILNGKMPYPVIQIVYTSPTISIEGEADIICCILNMSTRHTIVHTMPQRCNKQLWNICDNLYIQSGTLDCL